MDPKHIIQLKTNDPKKKGILKDLLHKLGVPRSIKEDEGRFYINPSFPKSIRQEDHLLLTKKIGKYIFDNGGRVSVSYPKLSVLKIEPWSVSNELLGEIGYKHGDETPAEGDIQKIELTPDITKQLSQDELVEVLGKTIKHDEINKLITFYAMLLTYTEDSQVNVSYRAPSSTGKSYIPLEIAEFFPAADIIRIGYSSPTAFFHERGGWDDKLNGFRVNLERKIIIFLDQPHDQLLQRLRPLLSHDQKEILVKITDKAQKRGLRTKNVILQGFPTVIFCTGDLRIDEQEATRNFVLSPETNQEKIREAISLKAFKKANPSAFEDTLKNDPQRENLRKRILAIRQEAINHVIIPGYEKIVQRFIGENKWLKPRHTRDVSRLISLIQGHALLDLWNRERDGERNVIASEEDIELGFKLWNNVSESQELGLVPYIHELFKEIIKPLAKERNYEGLQRRDIISKHYEVYGRPLPDWLLRREVLPALESCGLIYEETDQNDRRRTLIFTPPSCSLYPQGNRERGSGVTLKPESVDLPHLPVPYLSTTREVGEPHPNGISSHSNLNQAKKTERDYGSIEHVEDELLGGDTK